MKWGKTSPNTALAAVLIALRITCCFVKVFKEDRNLHQAQNLKMYFIHMAVSEIQLKHVQLLQIPSSIPPLHSFSSYGMGRENTKH